MRNLPFRAFRFDIPDGGDPEEPCGLRLGPRGAPAMVAGAASVRQAIFLLLSTVPGERVMRPDYGCDLHRLVFQPSDDTTAGLAIHAVRKALERFEPRVEITHLDAQPDPTHPEILQMILHYRVRALRELETLVFSFDLSGGAST